MTPARRNNFFTYLFTRCVRWWTLRQFKAIVPTPFEPRPGHSIFLLINHHSWWDGFFGYYLAVSSLRRNGYIMMQEDQFKKHWYLNFIGAYSLKKNSRDIVESLAYTANLLNSPENLVIMFPQGALYSNYITHLHFEKGIERVIKQIKGPCQIVYACTLIDYFESLKPSAYIHLYDCGVAGTIPFEQLVQNINNFHQQALAGQVNVEH